MVDRTLRWGGLEVTTAEFIPSKMVDWVGQIDIYLQPALTSAAGAIITEQIKPHDRGQSSMPWR